MPTVFLILSLVFIVVDLMLPPSYDGGLGLIVVVGLFVLSAAFLVLFVAFRGRSF